ncbi:MAG: sugar phosphate isomerase/epimerase [Victivallales bacterium]|nr:sugar phosphate isomerase/epimerase [Victivallales bacterium]
MNSVPLTMLYDFEHTDDAMRRCVMLEFAKNGCPNLVLTDTLIEYIMRSHRIANLLHDDLAATGCRFVDAHSPFGPHIDLHVVDETEHRMLVLRHSLAMEVAASFGVDSITIHVGNGQVSLPGYTFEQYQSAAIRSLKELVPLAEKLNITICIENIWTDITTPESLLQILKAVDSPYVGICYDAGHANLMARDRGYETSAPISTFVEKQGKTIPYDEHILEKLLPHVVNCHLHDNKGQTDEHTLPGRGDIDWPHVMGLLKQAPRLKCIQSEVIPVRQNIAICELCAKFKELMAM